MGSPLVMRYGRTHPSQVVKLVEDGHGGESVRRDA